MNVNSKTSSWNSVEVNNKNVFNSVYQCDQTDVFTLRLMKKSGHTVIESIVQFSLWEALRKRGYCCVGTSIQSNLLLQIDSAPF